MVKNPPLRNSSSVLSLRPSIEPAYLQRVGKSEEEIRLETKIPASSISTQSDTTSNTPLKNDPFLEVPVPTSALNATKAPNASPFATLSHGGAQPRWPWSLDATTSPPITNSRTVAPEATANNPGKDDPMFRRLLQQRLEDVKGQLAKPGLSQSMIWYLEMEIRRIEGKVKETEPIQVPGVKKPEEYTKPFLDFLTENPTVFHAVDYFSKKLTAAGFKKLSERSSWDEELQRGGKYFVERNGSSLIAFKVGASYKSGNGIAIIAGHIDALTARLKPVSVKKTTAGYVQLGVAPYAGALNQTWWDRDLSIGGRVIVKDPQTGKITSRLVKLGWPIARIPTLAPHFGAGMLGSSNKETELVPIIGLDNSSEQTTEADEWRAQTLGGASTFASTQPPRLVRAIAGELQIQDYSTIINWELELFDTQPAAVGGLDKEFIFAGRIDDKLCSWAALEGLLAAPESSSPSSIKLIGLFDDEEIGSLLRQGAKGNFLPATVDRITTAFASKPGPAISAQTYANSFLVSADVIHAVNPNFVSSYLPGHAPHLNVGAVVQVDSNGHMTSDAVSTAFLTRIAEKSGSKLQVFMIRNDSRSGGTVGPMLSSATGIRAIDCGLPQLSMHSIRATTGSLDPGLGVKLFAGFYEFFEEVDAEFVDE